MNVTGEESDRMSFSGSDMCLNRQVSASPRRRRVHLAAIVVVCALVPVLFACYTDARAEDAFISLRHSRNLALGQGLTYQPGDRIQGFSSPAVALIAALAFELLGGDAVPAVISVLRLLNVCGFALAVFAVVAATEWTSRTWIVYVAVCMLVLETKTVVFSINGMETGLVVGLLAVCARMLWSTTAPPIFLGLCFAVLLWTRPDAIVYMALIAAATLLWPPSEGTSRGALIAKLTRIGVWTALAYVPWLITARLTYGSVVPQSIVAKSARIGAFDLRALAGKVASIPEMWTETWLPPYASYGGWWWLWPCAFAIGAAGALAWCAPRAPASVRRYTFIAFGGTAYLALLVGTTPWYFPAIVPFSLAGVTWTIEVASSAVANAGRLRRAALVVVVTLVVGLLGAAFLRYAVEARAAESNERINRMAIGVWLRDRVQPTERVYLECPGFIGFYSNRRMLDYPGLVAPEVSDVIRKEGLGMAAPVRRLKPEWLVLRPTEAAEVFADEINLRNYQPVKTFDTRERLSDAGRRSPIVMSNALFTIFRRRSR